ncbi:MAG: flagellar hook-length control protein FliK [Desulfovibrionaceae bacterium]
MQFFPISCDTIGLEGTAATLRSDAVAAAEERFSGILDGIALKGRNASGIADIKAVKDGKAVPINEVQMTREDFAALRKSLKQYGLSDDELNDIADQVGDGGYTWGQFLECIGQKMDLSSADALQPSYDPTLRRELQSLFQKLGNTPQEAQKLLTELDNGNYASVWSSISGSLANLGDGSTLDVSRSELVSLGKALQLTAEAKAKLNLLFNNMASGTLDSDEAKAAMSFIKQAAAEAQTALDDKSRALKKQIGKVLNQAVDRAEAMRDADNRQTKDIENLKVLMNKTLLEGGEGEDENAAQDATKSATGTTGEHPLAFLRAMAAKNAATTAQEGKEATTDTDVQGASKSAKETLAAHLRELAGETADDASQDDLTGAQDDTAQDAHAKAWKDMLKKVVVDGGTASSLAGTSSGKGMDAALETAAGLEKENVSAEKILRQVETGMLKDLGQGRRQLTLRLDPAELGEVTVILQVRNKDVTALIRTQDKDVTTALTEQMAQLRAALEEQGLKVEKLEVQTQLPQANDNASHSWQGAERHNDAQAREEISRMMQRLRNTRSIGGALAQEMQLVPETATISPSGLHVIA